MNQLIAKKAMKFSLLFGAGLAILFAIIQIFLIILSAIPFLKEIIALDSIISQLLCLILFLISFFSSISIILYMKKNEKHLSYLTYEQGGILGGIIGFFATVGFFLIFTPANSILHAIFKISSYGIPYLLSMGAWLFFVIIFVIALIIAATNSAMAMGLAYIFNRIEKKPQDFDAPLDIKIED